MGREKPDLDDFCAQSESSHSCGSFYSPTSDGILSSLQKLLLGIQTHWLSGCRHHTEEHTAEMSACFIAATNCVPTKQKGFQACVLQKVSDALPRAALRVWIKCLQEDTFGELFQ